MAKLEIKVSSACYNEIANAMEQLGQKLSPGATITIDKDDKIINPTDWRFLKVRFDAAQIAANAIMGFSDKMSPESFLQFSDSIYKFILKGETEEVKKAEWK